MIIIMIIFNHNFIPEAAGTQTQNLKERCHLDPEGGRGGPPRLAGPGTNRSSPPMKTYLAVGHEK